MTRRILAPAAALLLALAACGSQEPPSDDTAGVVADSSATVAVATNDLHCTPSDNMPAQGRASAYDSTAVPLGDATALVCYGRPLVKGRTVFGELIPFGKLWRTGANEPTIVHLPVAATIAGIAVEPGSYSLYTVPGEQEWTIIVNRSTSQWGIESAYTPEIQAQEVGRANVPATRTDAPVEAFTIRATPAASGADLILEWENTRVAVPIARS
jgi:hypothetical protein